MCRVVESFKDSNKELAMNKQKLKAGIKVVRGVGQIITGAVAAKNGKSSRARGSLNQGRKNVQDGITQFVKKKS